MGIPQLGQSAGMLSFQEAWQRLRQELPGLQPLDIANLLSAGDQVDFSATAQHRLVRLGGDESVWRGVITPLEGT